MVWFCVGPMSHIITHGGAELLRLSWWKCWSYLANFDGNWLGTRNNDTFVTSDLFEYFIHYMIITISKLFGTNLQWYLLIISMVQLSDSAALPFSRFSDEWWWRWRLGCMKMELHSPLGWWLALSNPGPLVRLASNSALWLAGLSAPNIVVFARHENQLCQARKLLGSRREILGQRRCY